MLDNAAWYWCIATEAKRAQRRFDRKGCTNENNAYEFVKRRKAEKAFRRRSKLKLTKVAFNSIYL